MNKLKWVIVVMAAVLAVGLAACSSDEDEVREPIVSPFVLNPYAAIPDYILYPNGIQFSAEQNPQRLTLEQLVAERNALQVIHNDYFYVYMGEWFDMYFVDRRTGHIFPTNPVFMDFSPEQRAEEFSYYVGEQRLFRYAERVVYSQISIVGDSHYGGRRPDFAPFPYVVSENMRRVIWETGTRNHYTAEGELIRSNPTITITYAVGRHSVFPIIEEMTMETFEHHSARLVELVEQGVISAHEKSMFVDNYMLIIYTDIAGTPYHVDYIRRYPMLAYLGYLYRLTLPSDQICNEFLRISRLLGIGDEEVLEELYRTGWMRMGSRESVIIPLVYELDGNTILMYIDTAQICQPRFDALERIYLNRTFGASLSGGSGYSVLPILEHGANTGGIMEMAVDGVPYSMVFAYINFDAYYHTQFTVRYNFLYDEWATPEGRERFMQLYFERVGAGK